MVTPPIPPTEHAQLLIVAAGGYERPTSYEAVEVTAAQGALAAHMAGDRAAANYWNAVGDAARREAQLHVACHPDVKCPECNGWVEVTAIAPGSAVVVVASHVSRLTGRMCLGSYEPPRPTEVTS